jgi:GNAT superfamily N-acetyltransferase
VARRLASITLDNLSDLPSRCRGCVYWELDPIAGERAVQAGGAELEKEAWASDCLLEWGSCGQIAYVDGVAAGYVLYAPPAYVPRSVAFPTSPPSPDAVLLMTAWLAPEFRGAGLGRMLVQTAVRDVTRRGIRAVEAFGRHGPGRAADEESAALGCLVPVDYLLSVGFKTVRPHARTPRLRLDVKSTATWKADVEYALERLLSSMQSPALAPG